MSESVIISNTPIKSNILDVKPPPRLNIINTVKTNNSNEKKCKQRTRNGQCKHKAVVGDLCSLHNNIERRKINPYIVHDGPTRECKSKAHGNSNSQYHKKNVPVEKFYKSEGQYYDRCIDCREDRSSKIEKLIVKSDDPNYGSCYSETHDIPGVSVYPRNKVPVKMFDKLAGKGKSKECLDCRNYANERKRKGRQNRKETCEEDEFFCQHCNNIFKISHRANNMDGTPSSNCITCKIKQKDYNKKYYQKFKDMMASIKIEKFKEIGCSCRRCKSIFLKPVAGTKYQVELKTYEKDGVRYVDYNNKKYNTIDFINTFEDLLELRTIDLDHLTEEEQRARGIIGPNDIGIKKRGKVSDMQTEEDMREEAKITQNLCCKCHVIVTMNREKGDGSYTSNYIEKLNYVNELKAKGCEVCKYSDTSLTRYFEFDHIDPELKLAIISDMVRMNKYSVEELIEECKKCRVLCRACHRIHSNNQQLGIA